MRFRLVTFSINCVCIATCTFFLSTMVRGDVICQVIEELECEISENTCAGSTSCFDIGNGPQCFEMDYKTHPNTYFGVRPADTEKMGFSTQIT
jgi:hypothetical protein